jgi:OmpA-OmpF porin, OOP family
MKSAFVVLTYAMCLSGCAERAAMTRLGIGMPSSIDAVAVAVQDRAAGAPTQQWLATYAPIQDRRAALVQLRQRLGSIDPGERRYAYAKAQCWTEAGQQALDARDQWGFVEEAIGEAAMLTAGLETGGPLPETGSKLRTVTPVRPDLWRIASAIASDPAAAGCADAHAPLACAEVTLTLAGHEAWTANWRGAEQTVTKALDQLRESASAALACAHAEGMQ